MWLFVARSDGVIYLFSEGDITKNDELKDAVSMISTDSRESDWEPERERDRRSALRARMSQSSIKQRRVSLSPELFDVCGELIDRAYVWIPQPQTFLEIWTTTYAQKILGIPASELLPKTFRRKP